jgi:hypothetical protein
MSSWEKMDGTTWKCATKFVTLKAIWWFATSFDWKKVLMIQYKLNTVLSFTKLCDTFFDRRKYFVASTWYTELAC